MGFQQGLSGLNASSKALDTIGNNIANSGTVGFKSATAQFADVFAASLNGAGTAPIGLGSKVAGIAQQFTQGSISVTNNPLDTAINGGGFFMMSDAGGTLSYSRNGQFQLDRDGFIVNAQSLRLNGIMAKNGVIPPGAPAEPLRLFDPTQSLTGAPQATGGSVAKNGVQANINLDARQGIIYDSAAAPSPLPTGTSAADFNFNNPTTYNQTTSTTIYDSLGNAHTYSMYFKKVAVNTWDVYGTVTNPDGSTVAVSPMGPPPQPLQTVTFGTAGTIQSVTHVVSGSAGTTSGAVDGLRSDGTADPTLAAQLITAADLGYAGGVGEMVFNLDFAGTTQYGSNFVVNSMAQDGFASGSLSGFSIATDGTVLGRYTNGQSKTVGQVQLAIFRNPQGLQPLGNNLWGATSDSGTAIVSSPGTTGQYGVLQSAALEDSNVDLTAELVTMITMQRAYQANAQTIKTQDSVLQTLVNLR